MVEKKADRAAKRVKGLRAKGMNAKQANRVKGGVIAIIAPSSNPRVGSELLPYLEQKR